MPPAACTLGIDLGSTGCRFALRHQDRTQNVWASPAIEAWGLAALPANDLPGWKGRLARAEASGELARYVESMLTAGALAAQQLAADPIQRAALAIPASYPLRGRQILHESARRLGLEQACLVSDSVALAAHRSHEMGDGNLLVFSCGATGFEVGAINLSAGKLQVLAYGGGGQLSGDELDRRTFRHAATRAFLSPLLIDAIATSEREVRRCAQLLRWRLARQGEVELVFEHKGDTFQVALTRSDQEQVVRQAVVEVLGEINRVLEAARWRRTDLAELLVAGGPTWAPGFAETVALHVGKPAVRVHDWAIASGAAWLAESMMSGETQSSPSVTLDNESSAARASELFPPDRVRLLLSLPKETAGRSPAVAERPQQPADSGPGAAPAAPADNDENLLSKSLSRRLAMRVIEKARQAIAAGRLEEAVGLSHQANADASSPEVFSAMIDVHCEAAAAHRGASGYVKSIEWLLCAVQHDRGNPKIRNALAERHLLQACHLEQTDQFEEAILAAERAFQFRPESEEIEALIQRCRKSLAR